MTLEFIAGLLKGLGHFDEGDFILEILKKESEKKVLTFDPKEVQFLPAGKLTKIKETMRLSHCGLREAKDAVEDSIVEAKSLSNHTIAVSLCSHLFYLRESHGSKFDILDEMNRIITAESNSKPF